MISPSRRLAAALAALALTAGGGLAGASPGAAVEPPAAAVTAGPAVPTLDVPPPGANDYSCSPDAAHPQPVVLVNGTFETMDKNWVTMSPSLAGRGYCVFAFNYGNRATGPIEDSAVELKAFVATVLKATGSKQVDLVGHSQGGMMPRYYLKYLGGAKKVDDLVGISPSNHGTTMSMDTGGLSPCRACEQQAAGSAFLTDLNAGGDTVRGPDYTVLTTIYDEVVTPYASQFLVGPGDRVTNIVLQDRCPGLVIEHDQTPNHPVVQQLTLDALRTDGPARKVFQPDCGLL